MRRLAALAAILTAVAASPATAGSPYSYLGRQDIAAASITMIAGVPSPSGHVAVWLGAQDLAGAWVQAGIQISGAAFSGDSMPCVFVETNDAVNGRVARCLRRVAFGEPVRIRVTFSDRHGAVVWVDGAAVGSERLGVGVERYATAERYLGGSIRFRIVSNSKGG